MASVFDVAQYILEKTGKQSVWKLQKLCWYSQAEHITRTGEKLFRERFEAWSNGPVCPILYHACSGQYTVTASELETGEADNLRPEERESADIVIARYGWLEPYELREESREEPLWLEAWGDHADGDECHAPITADDMLRFFATKS